MNHEDKIISGERRDSGINNSYHQMLKYFKYNFLQYPDHRFIIPYGQYSDDFQWGIYADWLRDTARGHETFKELGEQLFKSLKINGGPGIKQLLGIR
jgi:hypothetical protein